MYHRMRRKYQWRLIFSAIFTVQCVFTVTRAKTIVTTESIQDKPNEDFYDNNIIDLDDEFDIKFDNKYGINPNWNVDGDLNKESHRYSIADKISTKLDVSTTVKPLKDKENQSSKYKDYKAMFEATTDMDVGVIPLELTSTTENNVVSLSDSTDEPDLTVIPLSTTKKNIVDLVITESVTVPTSTANIDTTPEMMDGTTTISSEIESTIKVTTEKEINSTIIAVTTTKPTTKIPLTSNKKEKNNNTKPSTMTVTTSKPTTTRTPSLNTKKEKNNTTNVKHVKSKNNSTKELLELVSTEIINTVNKTDRIDTNNTDEEKNPKVPVFTVLDVDESIEVPEDYYDTKDILPTKAPSNDALSVIFGLAGSVVESVVESVAEKVVPRGIFDLFKRMQKQNEALEAERLRSREENGGLGQFGRGILKTISTGLSKPLSQLMAGVRESGSLDNDRSFVTSLASGVSNVATVANSLVDNFKDRVQAIYPGTLWCGDGHVAQARSSDLGLFFFTDTCCRQHDSCKIYIRAGDTKYGLTNTGLFTRSHCSCDELFRKCLQKTNSLVSTQIGLTYFNVLGPQCFRKAHPIVKCTRRTRITGQKCEEYEMDYTKPKMWQWFDNETF